MRFRLLSVVGVFLLASVAFGDGCYIPERAVRKIPEIPAQRAIVSWKNGVETLVIASALDSEAQKLGWIIPVPAVPTTIEKESPGVLRTLNFCIQPRITHDLVLRIRFTIIVIGVANLLVGTFLFNRKRFLTVLFWLLAIGLFFACLLPAAGVGSRVATRRATDVQVEKAVAVGAYDVAVLRAEKAAALNTWLDENGFARLPTAADKTIADYVSQGWVFAAIKLTRAEAGTNAPHPIKIVFDSPEAVYPMRLTAIAGGYTAFEIFLISSDGASCDMLEKEFSDRFSKEYADGSDDSEKDTWFDAVTTHQAVGHPGVCLLMWDNCVLTKFSETIDHRDMQDDLRFVREPFKPCQQHFYTRAGAWGLAIIVFVQLTGLWCVATMILCRNKIRQPRGRRWYFGRAVIPAVALFAMGAGLAFAVVSKLDPSEVSFYRGHFGRHYAIEASIEGLLDDHPEILERSEMEIAEWLLKSLRGTEAHDSARSNTVVGEELRIEDSPGNFTVEKQQDKVVVRVYDNIGSVSRTERPIPNPSGTNGKPSELNSVLEP